MSDNSKSRDAFARASLRATNPDGSPLRDKDNAAPTPKPANIRSNNPALAPGGAMGIRQTAFRTNAPQPQAASRPVNDNRSQSTPWIDGKITTMQGYEFKAKMHDSPSKHGIDGGRISKLQVKKDGREVMNYDRGWDQKPKTPEQKEALHRIRNGLGDTQRKEFKGFAADKTKSKGMER